MVFIVDSAALCSGVDMFLISFMPQLRNDLKENFHAVGNNNAFERLFKQEITKLP